MVDRAQLGGSVTFRPSPGGTEPHSDCMAKRPASTPASLHSDDALIITQYSYAEFSHTLGHKLQQVRQAIAQSRCSAQRALALHLLLLPGL